MALSSFADRPQDGILKVILVEHRSGFEGRPERDDAHGRIHVAGVVGDDDAFAVDPLEFLEPFERGCDSETDEESAEQPQ